jgi:hypothetical protein
LIPQKIAVRPRARTSGTSEAVSGLRGFRFPGVQLVFEQGAEQLA